MKIPHHHCIFAAALAAMLAGAVHTQAAQVALDPGVPLDFYSAVSNGTFSFSRGVVFVPDIDLTLTGAGLWTDPVGSFTYDWRLHQTNTYPGFANSVLLASQSVTPTDIGLGFYDMVFATPVALSAGQNYHIEVTYTGLANGNYFYSFNQGNVDLGDLRVLDGAGTASTTNTVMPLFRVNVVPEPGSAGLLALGALALLARRRR